MKIREKYEAKALKTFIGYDMNNWQYQVHKFL
jgi:hypothetical protein